MPRRTHESEPSRPTADAECDDDRSAGSAAPILIGLGANLPSERFGGPRETLKAALAELARRGIRTVRRSAWYESAPVPPSDQPWYVNAVAAVETDLGPEAVMVVLHEVERDFGRERGEPNAARVVDLDLLAYRDLVRPGPLPPILPHPRAHERAFVLLPLAEVAPGWRHPGSRGRVEELVAELPPGQQIRRLAG